MKQEKLASINSSKEVFVNIEKYDNIFKTLSHYKKMLNADRFIITGSFMYYIQGLVPEMPNDLDIIVVTPEEEAWKTLENLKIRNKKDAEEEYPEDDSRISIRTETGMKIDFFKRPHPPIDTVFINEKEDMFELSTIMDSINAKKRYPGEKHFWQRMNIAMRIFGRNELDNYINKKLT